MRLNGLKPAKGSRPSAKRVGRGIGSGLGKTAGRGHKGQKSRSGGFHKVGFEGGQMPLQRRLPKVGFTARASATYAEVRLGSLAKIDADVITPEVLKAHKLAPAKAKRIKVFLSGQLTRAVTLKGVNVSKGALAAIEAAGGGVES